VFTEIHPKMTLTPQATDPEAAQFKDEPKVDNTFEDVAFVNDNGEGTASLMKPRKPVRHHRVHQTHYDLDGKGMGAEGPDDASVSTLVNFKESKWAIVSALIFVISSLLYLAMACMVMDYYWHYKEVPRSVYFADDDATWWNYFVNCTDDAFFPENVTNADDDWTWTEWYNNTAFHEDDYVWTPKIANADAPFPENQVSKYMILYFFAALGFLITGVIEVVLTRRSPLSVQVLYYLMILAAAFGLVSAILTNKSPIWSNICNCVSTNLWALEAIFIVAQRLQGKGDYEEYDNVQTICHLKTELWLWIADISFLIGTLGDAITSWLYVFEYDNYTLGISAVIFALMWQICAFVYLTLAIYDWNEYKMYLDESGEYEQETKAVPEGVIVKVDDVEKPVDDNGGGDNAKDDICKDDGTQNTASGSPPTSSLNSLNEGDTADAKKKTEDDVDGVNSLAVEIPVARATTEDLDKGCCALPISN
jgi:hypothetical protein